MNISATGPAEPADSSGAAGATDAASAARASGMADTAGTADATGTADTAGTAGTTGAVGAAEREVVELSRRLIAPGERECLRCYLVRMLDAFGCDNTHRWTKRWRDLRAPRATALLDRLAAHGGCCCDCEVIFNVYPSYPQTDGLLPCAGVSRVGSTQPCRPKAVADSDQGSAPSG